MIFCLVSFNRYPSFVQRGIDCYAFNVKFRATGNCVLADCFMTWWCFEFEGYWCWPSRIRPADGRQTGVKTVVSTITLLFMFLILKVHLHQLLRFFYIISLEVRWGDQGFVVYLPVRDYSRVAKSLIRSQDVDLLEERLIIKPLSSNCHLNLGGHKTWMQIIRRRG